MYPSRALEKIVIRSPDGMRAALAERARRNLRSTNAEIIMILANALGDEGQAAVGEKLPGTNPTAGHHEAALQGGPATHG